jgi:8-amino-7-oxononanoate synthase
MLAEPERINHLWDVTRHAKKGLNSMGFDTGSSESPIIPIFIHDDIKALQMTQMLLEDGVFVNPVVYPAVPKEDCLIRFSLMATHSIKQVDTALAKIQMAGRKIGVLSSSTVMN